MQKNSPADFAHVRRKDNLTLRLSAPFAGNNNLHTNSKI